MIFGSSEHCRAVVELDTCDLSDNWSDNDYNDYNDYSDYRDSDLDLYLDRERFSDLVT